ncbi:hypothetical protein E2C01_094215 [Portunus trituberculatus]|uniref:Uncharacterized protein n=1 Tax=Portunus trituberculatus TaxID=210409 RepID=A0A5B7JPU7_PORTR|nr:hypothetical protein [Portunus trituberculatus]
MSIGEAAFEPLTRPLWKESIDDVEKKRRKRKDIYLAHWNCMEEKQPGIPLVYAAQAVAAHSPSPGTFCHARRMFPKARVIVRRRGGIKTIF